MKNTRYRQWTIIALSLCLLAWIWLITPWINSYLFVCKIITSIGTVIELFFTIMSIITKEK